MKIMVSNDGETFTDLSGCMIVDVPETMSDDEIKESLRNLFSSEDDGKLKIIVEFKEDRCMINYSS